MVETTPEPRYVAFISYRHEPVGRRWAVWLHRAIEHYRVPGSLVKSGKASRRLGRVFRDEEELAASADLSKEIDAALVASRFLIVVCTPRTPHSRWVNEEVRRFRELGRSERILALLVEGEPRESFPPALVEIRRRVVDAAGSSSESVEQVEPLAADVRETSSSGSHHARSQAKLRLLATMLGVGFDDLRNRHQRRAYARALSAALVLLCATVFTAAVALYATRQRSEAVRQREIAEAATAEAVAARHLADSKTYDISVISALTALNSHDVAMARNLLAGSPKELRGWEWAWLDAQCDQSLVAFAHTAGASELPIIAALSPDNRTVASAREREIQFWDTATGRCLRTLAIDPVPPSPGADGIVVDLRFSPDGSRVVVGLGNFAVPSKGNGTVVVIDVFSGQTLLRLPPQRVPLASATFDRTGTRLLALDRRGELRTWDARTGKLLANGFLGLSGWVAKFSPDGDRICGYGWESHLLIDAEAPSVIGEVRPAVRVWLARLFGAVHTDVAYLAGVPVPVIVGAEEHLAVAGDASGRAIEIYERSEPIPRVIPQELIPPRRALSRYLQSWAPSESPTTLPAMTSPTTKPVREPSKRLYFLYGHDAPVTALAADQTGSRIASGSLDRTVRLWNVRAQSQTHLLHGHEAPITQVDFSKDQTLVLSAARDGTVRLWSSSGTVDRIADAGRRVAFFPDGRRFLGADYFESAIRAFDETDYVPLLEAFAVNARDVAISGDGRFAVTAGTRPQPVHRPAVVWDLVERRQVKMFAPRTWTAAFNPDGTRVVTGSETGEIVLWDWRDAVELARFRITDDPVSVASAVYSPDGARILAASPAGAALFDVATGARTMITDRPVHCAAFDRDGQRIVIGTDDRAIIYDAATARETVVLGGHTNDAAILTAAFSHDGGRVVTGGADRTVRIWHAGERRQILLLRRYEAEVTMVAFSPDGTRLVTCAGNGTVYVDDSIPYHKRYAGFQRQ